jgi:hypothetical protein
MLKKGVDMKLKLQKAIAIILLFGLVTSVTLHAAPDSGILNKDATLFQ